MERGKKFGLEFFLTKTGLTSSLLARWVSWWYHTSYELFNHAPSCYNHAFRIHCILYIQEPWQDLPPTLSSLKSVDQKSALNQKRQDFVALLLVLQHHCKFAIIPV